MFKYHGHFGIIVILGIILVCSCSRQVMNGGLDSTYYPYSEEFDLRLVDITHDGLNQLLKDYSHSATLFEAGMNSYSPYSLEHYIVVSSFCRNDSSFLMLKIMAGSYYFYGFSKELDNRKLSQLRLVEENGFQILILKELKNMFCKSSSSKINFFRETDRVDKFRLNWFKNKKDVKLIELSTGFYDLYYFEENSFSFFERLITPPITEIK